MLLRELLLPVLVVFSLTAIIQRATAQDANANDRKSQIEPFRDEKTGLQFIDVPGLERTKAHRYEEPGLGYDVTYRSKLGLRCTIYVYTLGQANISEGPFGADIRQQLQQAKGDIVSAHKQGIYQKAEEISGDIVVLGESDNAPRIHRSRFRLRRFDKDWVSYIYLTGYKKHFVKLRCTLPSEQQAECEKELAKVLARLGVMLTADDGDERS